MSRIVPPNPTARIPEYWGWIALVLFLLFPIDLLTTMIAVDQFGLAAEVNPFMRFLFHQGLVTLTIVHVVLAVVTALCCYGVLETIRMAADDSQRSLALTFEIVLGSLLAAGLLIVSNNLFVIVLQQNLV